MSKSQSNTDAPNKPQVPAAAPNNKTPKTLAEFYAHAWEVVFSKLSKEDKAALLTNLPLPIQTFKGREIWPKHVRQFVKNVAELGEEMFEKSSKVVQVKG